MNWKFSLKRFEPRHLVSYANSNILPRHLRCYILTTLIWTALVSLVSAQPAQPQITSIRAVGSNILVTVQVPPGLRRVTLETRANLNLGAWEPQAVQRLDDLGGVITFTLPQTTQFQAMRVRANERDRLPDNFYRGTNTFAGRKTMEQTGSASSSPPDSAVPVFNPTGSFSTPSTLTLRQPEESDIWKRRDHTFYYFNHYRGLQVIDLSNADAPVLRGVYSLPAAGEEMYLLDDNHVVLLARMRCGRNSEESQVLVVNASSPSPALVASLTVPGRITESRLVGTALYVASEGWESRTNSSGDVQWDLGTHILSFDLADPTQPRERSRFWYASSGNVITVTDRFLFVAVRDQDYSAWRTTDVHCLDISAPDGVVRARGSVRVEGQVADKFRIHLHGDVLSVVSWGLNTNWASVTKLQTFSLAQPDSPVKLGQLELALGEQLFATRFDGSRLYAVTYRRVDPLWVIDLSNPARPRISGELQIPGWSTFIQPWGERLVTVGIDDVNGQRVAAQLFDVSDPARPALLSKVVLGENYSWSEANSNEKAVQVLPELGLILLPYQGQMTNGYATRVQLIDLATNVLTARGSIEHQFQPRRADVHRDRIYSISARELLAVDATDRDRPQVRATLELAWPVNQVLVQGEYLLELSKREPVVRVARASEPDRILGAHRLTNDWPVVGATLRDGNLYLAQGQSHGGWPELVVTFAGQTINSTNLPTTNAPTFQLSIIDLSGLPALRLLGTAGATGGPQTWSADLQAVWPRPGVLVWSGSESYPWLGWDWWPPQPIGIGLGVISFLQVVPFQNAELMKGAPAGVFSTAVQGSLNSIVYGSPGRHPWYDRGTSDRWLIAFDVQEPEAPRFLSTVNLATNGGWNFSEAHAADGLVFHSHQLDDREVTGTNYQVSSYWRSILETNFVPVTNVTEVYSSGFVTNITLRTNRIEMIRNVWPAGVRFFAGNYHNLALLPDGTVSTWGANTFGQLGDGAFINRNQFRAVPGLSGMAALAAGGYHSLSLQSDGAVFAWGQNSYGQVGEGQTNPPPSSGPPALPQAGVATPGVVYDLPLMSGLAGGGFHGLALTRDSTVWSWGANWNGQLGDGSVTNRFTPVLVAGLSNVSAIAAGSRHSLALLNDGSVWSWGWNDFGQLGHETTIDQRLPAPVTGLNEVIAVAGGFRHSLALKANGTVWSWGGDAWETSQPGACFSPRQVPGLSNVVGIAAGRLHNLALRSDGSLWTWGRNDFGQLGKAEGVSSNQPHPVAGLEGVTAITAGAYHSLAVRSDGFVWIWGDNRFGQLGEGERVTMANPLPIIEVIPFTNVTYLTNVTWQEIVQHRNEIVMVTNSYEVVTWVERHYLDALDYTDPVHPTSRRAVNIPGQLKGLSHQGALLYTVGTRDDSSDSSSVWLDASVYDEVSVSLLDSLRLTENGAQSVRVSEAIIFFGHPGTTNQPAKIESWTLSEISGRFALRNSAPLAAPAQSIFSFGGLLAVHADQEVHLFSASALTPLGYDTLPACLAGDLKHSDGDITQGLWLPLGDYGLKGIAVGSFP